MRFFEIETVNEPLKCFVPISIFQWKKNKIGQFIEVTLKNETRIICKAFPHQSEDFYGNCNISSSKLIDISGKGEDVKEFKFINENEILVPNTIFIEKNETFNEEATRKLIQGIVIKSNYYFNGNLIHSGEHNQKFLRVQKTTDIIFKDPRIEVFQEIEEENSELKSLEMEITEILSNYGKILIFGNSKKKNFFTKIEKRMNRKFTILNDIPDGYIIKNDEILYIENIEDLLIEESNLLEILKKKKISFLGGTNKSTIKDIKNSYKKNLKLINYPLPSLKTREQFFNYILTKFPNLKLDSNYMSIATEDFSEYDLSNLLRESLIESNLKFEELNQQHFVKSLVSIKSKFEHKSEKFENIQWNEIGGLEETKLILKQCSEWPLIYKDKFQKLGIVIPRGILLYGPPGCSKTKLIKALATSTRSKFLYLNSASIYSAYVGESEESIRKIFENAKKSTSSIIFFDEIDALVGKRDSNSKNSNVEKRVLSTLLNEMDGIEEISKNVLIVCATNRPEMIDSALMRPGRIDHVVYVPPPNMEERIEIFKIYSKNLNLTDDFDFNYLSLMFHDYTGAEIESVCRHVSLFSLNHPNEIITIEHFQKAKKLIHPVITQEMLKKYEEFKTNFNAQKK